MLDWHGGTPTGPRALERVAALGTVVGIFCAPQLKSGNLFEVIKARLLVTTAVAGYQSKFDLRNRRHQKLYSLLRQQLFDVLGDFVERIAIKFENRAFINENVLDEFALMYPRRMLVTALAACQMLEAGGDVATSVRAMVMQPVNYPFLDSEGLVPPFLAVFWAKQKFSGDCNSDVELMNVLRSLIESAKAGTLISPYYDIEDVVQCRWKAYLGRAWHAIDDDVRKNMSQFSYLLTCMLAKRNWKQTVRSHWPDVTRLARQQTRISDPNEFGFYRSNSASEETLLVEIPQTWDQFTGSFAAPISPNIPTSLQSDPVLCVLLLTFLPFRATEEMVLWLDRTLCKTWY